MHDATSAYGGKVLAMAHRKRVTVMAGDVPLYDAKIDAMGDVFLVAAYAHPTDRPVRYERVQQDELARMAAAQTTKKPGR